MAMRVPKGLCHGCLKPLGPVKGKYHDGCRPPTKYRSRKTRGPDGQEYDSAKEARRHGELLLLEEAGLISGLERQPGYDLVVNGLLVCRYLADFRYVEGGVVVVEDVKSAVTRKNRAYRIKAKLLLALYGIEVRET